MSEDSFVKTFKTQCILYLQCIVFAGNIRRLCLQGIYKDCVCREYTKIVFAGNIQRLCLRGIYKDCVCREYTKTREVAHWHADRALGMPGIGIHAARTGRGCSYALLLTTALLLCCFCAFVLLCTTPHWYSTLTRTKVCIEQHGDQLLHIHWLTWTHTHVHAAHWPIGGGERSPNNRSQALQSRSSSHAHTHAHRHICALLPFSTVIALCLFSVLFLQCAHFAFCI